jgi:RNA polymerase sigma factor for flagellar operon FliA
MYSNLASESTNNEERERLILEHLPQVRLIARRILTGLPKSVLLEDLVSAGAIGLMAAIDGFDPAQNVRLCTYAEYRIRGAIFDSLRRLDWAPRLARRRAKQIDAAVAEAEQCLQRSPTEEETAAQLTISIKKYRAWRVEVSGLDIARLEGIDGNPGKAHRLFNSRGLENLQSALLERADLERALAQAMEGILDIERTVLNLYYREELTVREVAQVVKLAESRVYQLKSRAISRLRSQMAGAPRECGAGWMCKSKASQRCSSPRQASDPSADGSRLPNPRFPKGVAPKRAHRVGAFQGPTGIKAWVGGCVGDSAPGCATI